MHFTKRRPSSALFCLDKPNKCNNKEHTHKHVCIQPIRCQEIQTNAKTHFIFCPFVVPGPIWGHIVPLWSLPKGPDDKHSFKQKKLSHKDALQVYTEYVWGLAGVVVGETLVRPALQSFPEAAEAGPRVSVVFRKPAELLH